MSNEGFIEALKRSKVERVSLSPTRRNNPQMIGLVHQAPLAPNAQVM